MEAAMGNYLKMAIKQQIKALIALNWSYRRIQKETGVHRETIARYAREGDSKPAKVPAGSEACFSSKSQAAPHHHFILAGIERGLTAQRIYEDLVLEYGYTGSYDSVLRYTRKLKKTQGKAVGVMQAAPGEEAQVDFFAGPPTLDASTGKYRRTHVFVMTLCCSRHSYEEAVFTQKTEPFIRCHENAFKEFGGVPRVVRLDNLKAGVTRACLYDPDVSEAYAAFARHYGFTPLPCRPGNPREKGKVERAGGYLKNALKGRRFGSLDELNQFLRTRNRTVSSLRIHGTTKKQVISHFLEVEKPALLPLADLPFSLFEQGTRMVHPDGHVQIKGAFYPVPYNLIGRDVTVRFDDRLVKVLSDERIVAVHPRIAPGTYAPGGFGSQQELHPRQLSYQKWLFARVERIGPEALAWAKAAEQERGVRAYRLIQGLLSFCRRHPRERVNWACKVAHEARVYRYRTLSRLLGQAKEKSSGQLSLIQSHELIRPLSHYRLTVDQDDS
jgi:transposase